MSPPGGQSAFPAAGTNGGFESGLDAWRPIWSRLAGGGQVQLDAQVAHSGTHSARLAHSGLADWSFEPDRRVPAQGGDIFELEAWIKVAGAGTVTLCASTWDAAGENLRWASGRRSMGEGEGLVPPADPIRGAQGSGPGFSPASLARVP